MSSKGQVVIPKNIRKQLNLKPGSRFVVVGDRDVVILNNISPPSLDEFDDLIADARKKAKKAGLKQSDIKNAIERVRGKKKR
jgi:AbrB family looped-hinge helix DNA binding protein